MSTPTPRNRFELIAVGTASGTWGDQGLNVVIGLIDDAADGEVEITTIGGTTTLTASDYVADQARCRTLIVAGSLASDATVVIPNAEKWYWIDNRTTGDHDVNVKTASGDALTLPRSAPCAVYCDGSDHVRFLVGGSGAVQPPRTITGDYAAGYANLGDMLHFTASGALTLPPAATVGASWWADVKADAGATVTVSGSDAIDAGTVGTLFPGGSVRIYSVGTGYVSIFGTAGWGVA